VPPTLLMLLAIVAVQLGSALATALFPSLGAAGTACLVTLIAGLAVLALESARGAVARRRLAAPWAEAEVLRRHGLLLLLFAVDQALMPLAYFKALETLPLGVAATITFLGPLALAVITSRRPVHFLCIGLAVVGIALLAPDLGLTGAGEDANPVLAAADPGGVAWAVLAGIAWAGFVPLSQRAGAVLPGNQGLGIGLFLGGLLLIAPMLWTEGTDALRAADLLSWLGAAAVALLGTVAPLVLEFRALQRISARRYGILVTLEPAVGAVIGALFLDQPAGLRMVIAVACVTAAALGVTLTERPDRGSGAAP
jgi:inner membrane transporter RhtA